MTDSCDSRHYAESGPEIRILVFNAHETISYAVIKPLKSYYQELHYYQQEHLVPSVGGSILMAEVLRKRTDASFKCSSDLQQLPRMEDYYEVRLILYS